MAHIMFYEVFAEEEQALKKFLPKEIDALYTDKTVQEQGDRNPPAEMISIRTQSRIPPGWGTKLKAILTRSQGYDHLWEFRRKTGSNVPCGYIENYCSRAVAEGAVLALMMLLRKMKTQMKNFKKFKRDNITGLQCQGRKVLVLGVGYIGTQIVDIVKGLGMPVKGFDIKQKVKDLQYVSLANGVKWADIVFCVLPLTEKTRGLLSYDVLKQTQPGSIFINVARAEIAPVEDLKRLLDEKHLAGLSLDVYPQESILADYLRSGQGKISKPNQIILDLKDRPNVLFTPHNAFNTVESLQKKALLSAEAIISFSQKGKFPFPVPAE